jgi:prolipoprotein diacylglyceryl transferase
MFVIGFILASFLILREAKKRKIDQDYVLNVLLVVLIGAIIGGRLFFVFENLGYFLSHTSELISYGRGGETSYGGILLSILFAWIYTKASRNKNKIKFSELLDLIAPYVILGLAIGRIGCFLNWDDFGILSNLPWAILVPGDFARHPTQIYETIYCLGIFLILLLFRKIRDQGKNTRFRKLLEKKGSSFMFMLMFYSFFRFFNDFLRIYQSHWLGLALSQWICVALFLSSMLILILKKK